MRKTMRKSIDSKYMKPTDMKALMKNIRDNQKQTILNIDFRNQSGTGGVDTDPGTQFEQSSSSHLDTLISQKPTLLTEATEPQ